MQRLRLYSTSFIKEGHYVKGSWNIVGFPLPNILILIQKFVGSYAQRLVYSSYMVANISHNYYVISHTQYIQVKRISDDQINVTWTFPFQNLFLMQLIAISYNSTSQRAEHHRLYNHTGNEM